MAKIRVGLSELAMGDIAGDGGMGTVLTPLQYNVVDQAVMSTADGTTTDFNVEEQDDPVYSIVSTKGVTTLTTSIYDVDNATLARLFGGTVTSAVTAVNGVVGTFGSITPGSAYTNGTYTNVSLTGGTGTGAKATIVVSGGVVTAVTKTAGGSGYAVANNLSALAADIGGTGTGFTVPVATITAVSASPESWEAPASSAELEQSVRATFKVGGKVEIPRAKIAAKLQLNFQKTKLAQVDLVITALIPTKTGVGLYKISNY